MKAQNNRTQFLNITLKFECSLKYLIGFFCV